MRIALSDTLQVDDREQIFYAQSLSWGYEMPQPPLYSWLSFLLFKILGPNLITLTALKYLLIFASFFYLAKTSRSIFHNRNFDGLLILSYLLMPSFAWHMHQGFTHTIILSLAIAMTLNYLIQIFNTPSWKNYILFGLSVGIGLLSKYSYLIFLTLIAITLLFSKEYKVFLFNKKIAFSILIALLIATPHYLWLIDNWNEIFVMASDRLIGEERINRYEVLFEFLSSSLGFLTPLIILIIFGNIRILMIHKTSKKRRIETFFDNYFLILLIISLFVILSIDIKEVKVRWLHPLLMVFPFWALLKIERLKGPTKILKKSFFYLGAFITALVIIVRIGQTSFNSELGYSGRINVPIVQSLNKIPEKILQKVSTLYTRDYFLGPHLFSVFPKKNIRISNKKFYETNAEQSLCLILWDDDGYDDNHSLKFKDYSGKISEGKYTLFYKVSNLIDCQ